MRPSHSSSNSGGRAFNDGNDPTTPALHCAMTRSGTEMMKSGAPITGNDRRPLNKAGMDIGDGFLWLASVSWDALISPVKMRIYTVKMPGIIPSYEKSAIAVLRQAASIAR